MRSNRHAISMCSSWPKKTSTNIYRISIRLVQLRCGKRKGLKYLDSWDGREMTRNDSCFIRMQWDGIVGNGHWLFLLFIYSFIYLFLCCCCCVGSQVGNTRVKLGFGKSMPTNCVWLHGVADTVAEKFLARHMSRFGHVSYAAVDRERCNGLVFYDQVQSSSALIVSFNFFHDFLPNLSIYFFFFKLTWTF